MKVAINGFGRMGRLAFRAAWEHPELEIIAVNEPHADDAAIAHLLTFDSVQGSWSPKVQAFSKHEGRGFSVDESRVMVLQEMDPKHLPWGELGVELVIEASGVFRDVSSLEAHRVAGAKHVLVSCPIKGGAPNLVVGVNDGEIDFSKEPILSAASCTTNCLAPIVRVLHDAIGIERGLITTIHNPTNTQVVVDAYHHDLRRARASQINLIPTSTNSATAVGLIIPELRGKLDSIAVRTPVLNASLCDCVFSMVRECTVKEVNLALQTAAEQAPLRGILGYEERPLVSSDYQRDARSSIVDALSTRVCDGKLVKVMAWYDNEWGYANRLADLALKIAAAHG